MLNSYMRLCTRSILEGELQVWSRDENILSLWN
uniref:Uncharacterized protein n=1 Tax=Setaria italica TaxID=4555 RepID=K4AP55_SETIT